jgi:hypothetical protein
MEHTTPSINGVPLGALSQATLFNLEPIVIDQKSHNDKVNAIKKKNLERRNLMINEKFNQKYHVERKRIDDVIQELMSEYSLSKSTIESVLKKG